MSDVKIRFVITDNGDGSNSTHWVTDQDVIDRMEELADSGDGTYASGDGLQVTELRFPAGFDLEAWCKVNYIKPTTLKDLEHH